MRALARRAIACTLATVSTMTAISITTAAAQEPLKLYAAGSLKAALSEVATAFTAAHGAKIETTFAPSGLLRQRIEGGEAASVFASANMKHPQTLAAARKIGPVVLFARNRLCAIARPDVTVTTETLLDKLLDAGVRVGTSTPKADPSGDYAFELFGKAEALKSGAKSMLDGKALQLTGGPMSEKAPDGRNQYGWVMSEKKADIFLTYCTNAVLAKKDTADLQIVPVPEALSVGADYGLVVIDDANPAAWRLAAFILSPPGQAVLAKFGFVAGGTGAE